MILEFTEYENDHALKTRSIYINTNYIVSVKSSVNGYREDSSDVSIIQTVIGEYRVKENIKNVIKVVSKYTK